MSDYAEELRVSKEILTRVVDAYRKLRNTCRILVANLYDFDPNTDMVPLAELDAVDRFALGRYADAAVKMLRAYEEYDFPTVFQTMNALVTTDLSAFYVDVTKDRMYTLAARSHARRSTQTVMYLICDGLARLLAPILPVTADDLWRHMPGTRSASVHLEQFPAVAGLADRDIMGDWEKLLEVRETVQGALEARRQEKVIGNSLGARVMLTANGPLGGLLERYRADLPMLFIVSDVALTVGPSDLVSDLRVEVEKAPGVKCDRCWRYVPATHAEPDWAGICDRCVEALAEPVNR